MENFLHVETPHIRGKDNGILVSLMGYFLWVRFSMDGNFHNGALLCIVNILYSPPWLCNLLCLALSLFCFLTYTLQIVPCSARLNKPKFGYTKQRHHGVRDVPSKQIAACNCVVDVLHVSVYSFVPLTSSIFPAPVNVPDAKSNHWSCCVEKTEKDLQLQVGENNVKIYIASVCAIIKWLPLYTLFG